eukprot:CAMPEP_0201135116 /NCGR_PEP_ID=MMETSP0850-20130426/53624_1 /ASSEMBLY_ACC=CAM_ASM_000622 /TAXON_ID=183588 /ORGANISM="Pseudo-nitzschia fraudulenta, Strain WWA7" /LENGTH=86 /DNA_ID=CAMNT_0047406227 /DNA_START=10 /DNA_END=266 /DNA_ORIENTATION=+
MARTASARAVVVDRRRLGRPDRRLGVVERGRSDAGLDARLEQRSAPDQDHKNTQQRQDGHAADSVQPQKGLLDLSTNSVAVAVAVA